MSRRKAKPARAGFADQRAGSGASLGEAWTQAKSTKPVPDGRPSQFAEFEDEMPNSRARLDAEIDGIVPEHPELPSTAEGDKSHRRQLGNRSPG